MMTTKTITAAIVSIAMAGCTVQGSSLNLQAEQMERALLACKTQLGLPGQTQTQVRFDGGVASARVVPFDQINAQDAARINACANGGVEVLEDGLVVVPLDASLPMSTPVTVAAQPGLQPYTGGCPAGRSGMYGGTSYCFGGAH